MGSRGGFRSKQPHAGSEPPAWKAGSDRGTGSADAMQPALPSPERRRSGSLGGQGGEAAAGAGAAKAASSPGGQLSQASRSSAGHWHESRGEARMIRGLGRRRRFCLAGPSPPASRLGGGRERPCAACLQCAGPGSPRLTRASPKRSAIARGPRPASFGLASASPLPGAPPTPPP